MVRAMTILKRLAGVFRLRRGRPRRTPAHPVEDSVRSNFLVCLDTGTRHVALRRHLKEVLGLTPAEYRQRWGLPDDYPMVARNYVVQRSNYRTGLDELARRRQG